MDGIKTDKNKRVEQQVALQVVYDQVIVGDYYADLLVENSIVVGLKTVKQMDDSQMAQCINYLRATGLPLCLLINFYHPKVEVKRILNPFLFANNDLSPN